ncbi:hypothetical protein TNCT_624891 [Trichonephila clavata]|uniref:Uncharacterized protein n=1 Tax=Trichonephila clavata TaxID=2740835 RepID=A0A8X6JH68_TRICU|nr:hypothetical protein TNCT_624891 [Trichonephila clavata]
MGSKETQKKKETPSVVEMKSSVSKGNVSKHDEGVIEQHLKSVLKASKMEASEEKKDLITRKSRTSFAVEDSLKRRRI